MTIHFQPLDDINGAMVLNTYTACGLSAHHVAAASSNKATVTCKRCKAREITKA